MKLLPISHLVKVISNQNNGGRCEKKGFFSLMSIIHAKKKIANRGLKERSISKREGWYLGNLVQLQYLLPILSFYVYVLE